MTISGHEVEEAPNGAWWVSRPGTRLAWPLTTRTEALRFAGQFQAPAQERQQDPGRRRDRRDPGAA